MEKRFLACFGAPGCHRARNFEIAAQEALTVSKMYNTFVPHENSHRPAVAARFWQRLELG
jgi:hypothetical protein